MIGILLLNLGTPDAPTEDAVREYLDVFLSDPCVITLPKLLRDFLVQKIILPRRPKKTAHAYQQIWTPQGSPLLINSIALQNALSKKLGGDFCVALGMRYKNPTIESAIELLHQNQCEKIMLLPLFPQFAKATTQSALDEVARILALKKIKSEIKVTHEFYQDDFYINSVAALIEKKRDKSSEFLLMSYHGLPKRALEKNPLDYREQCIVSSTRIAKKLNLSPDNYKVCFQSRLGFTKWIGPYTDHSVKTLREKNIKRLSVVCPSFVTDCLETLEEINMRLRAQWFALGGESFEMIPCLNAAKGWVEALSEFITYHYSSSFR